MGRRLIASIVAILVPTYAVAAGPYVSLAAGVAFLEDSDLEGNGLDGQAEFDTGFVVSGAGGYGFDDLALGTVRTEIEIAYRQK